MEVWDFIWDEGKSILGLYGHCTKAFYGMFRERTKGGERGIKVVWGRKRVGKERNKGIKEAGYM